MTPQDVGRIIKEARELKRWSQESLAREAGGVGQSTIDRIEKGQFKRMPSDLPVICTALGSRASMKKRAPRSLSGRVSG